MKPYNNDFLDQSINRLYVNHADCGPFETISLVYMRGQHLRFEMPVLLSYKKDLTELVPAIKAEAEKFISEDVTVKELFDFAVMIRETYGK